jgi:hypothetical protein
MWVVVAIAVLYTAFVMLYRWRDSRAIESAARSREAAEDKAIVDKYGSGDLKLLTFYANPPQVSRGGKALLCYGVANAQSVRIEPGVEEIQPSLSRCVEVRPTQTTEYKLVAQDGSGRAEEQSVVVNVR